LRLARLASLPIVQSGHIRQASPLPLRIAAVSCIHRPRLTVCLALALASAPLAAQPLAADDPTWRLCGGNPAFAWQAQLRAPDDPDQALDLQATRADVSGRDVYRFDGGATLSQPGRRIAAERIDYTHSSGDYAALGTVRYQDLQLALQADSAQGNLPRREARLDSVDYRLIAARGNGRATTVQLDGELATLLGLDYSTCDPAARAWALRAKQLQLDRAAGVGVARNATLRIGNVPVLWLPWISFPVDERRRSGLLFPSLGYADETGIDVRVPWYLNLAPNIDATLTPRILGRRGVMLGAEFRYLTEHHRGSIEGNWLPEDDLSGRDRGSLRLRHSGVLSPLWQVSADLNHVSDDRYFEDFGDSLTARATSLLESRAGLHGRGPGWYASILTRDFQITDPLVADSAEPYRQLPRARFGLDRDLGALWRYGIDAEAVHFDHDETGLASNYARGAAQRYDLQPWIELNFERASGYLRPRLGYRYTAYQLSDDWLRSLAECARADCGLAPPRLWPDRSPSRSLPIASLDAALNFERPTRLFGSAMLQTLQPRLYYLHVPFENQDAIPLFDTQQLTFGWDQLFRSNRFSGADRQSDADQLTLALTSRWFEHSDGRERLALGLGQIIYFDPPQVALDGVEPSRRDESAYVASVDLALTRRLSFGLSQQWDPQIDRTTVSGARLQWRGTRGALGNLGYRYRRAELEQVDASFAIPLGEAWRWIGRWNYSLRDAGTLEAFAGFEWQSCCVAFRLLGRHYVRNRESEKNNALYLELELKGLASFGRDTGEFLQRAILGYSR
jgi:LPS-assembly protein